MVGMGCGGDDRKITFDFPLPTTTSEITPNEPSTTRVVSSSSTTTPEVTPNEPSTTSVVSSASTTPEVTPNEPSTTSVVSSSSTTPEDTPNEPSTPTVQASIATDASTLPVTTPTIGVPLRQILEQYEADFFAATDLSSHRLDCSWVAGQPLAGPVDRDQVVGRGSVLTCGILTEPSADVGSGYLLVLDDEGTTTWWSVGTGGADLPLAPHGLLCREYLRRREFGEAMQVFNVSPPWDESALAYQWVLAYWFLEGQPEYMDVDGNGVPCELLFDTAVVAEVWAGDF